MASTLRYTEVRLSAVILSTLMRKEQGSRPSVHGRARKSDGTARPRPAIDPFPRVHISLLAPPTSIIAKLFTTSFSVDLTVERSALLLARSFAMHKKVPAQTDRMRKSFLPWKLENLALSPISRRLGKNFNKLHFNFSIPICENVKMSPSFFPVSLSDSQEAADRGACAVQEHQVGVPGADLRRPRAAARQVLQGLPGTDGQ